MLELSSLSLLVILCSVTVAGFAGALAWEFGQWRRRRYLLPTAPASRRYATRAGYGLICLSVSAASVLAGINRHFAYIPTWSALSGNISPDLRSVPLTDTQLQPPPQAPPPPRGVVERVMIAGPRSGIESRVSYVYLPPAYFDGKQPHRRFPVLYLIHGSPGTAQDWLRGGYVDRTMDDLLAKHAIAPFIVVLPDANGGYSRDLECSDVVGGPQDQTYLTTDVVAFVDLRYRTVANRLGRAIGGLSTGGYCGLNLTFRHPDVFSAAISHSGMGHPDQNLYTGNLFGGNLQLVQANSPDVYLSNIAVVRPTGVYMDDGAGDVEARQADGRLYRVLQDRNVMVTWNIVQHEGHTFVAFRKNLSLSLPWVSNWFVNQSANSLTTQVSPPDDSYLPPPSLSDQGISPNSSHGSPTPPPPGLLNTPAEPPRRSPPPPPHAQPTPHPPFTPPPRPFPHQAAAGSTPGR